MTGAAQGIGASCAAALAEAGASVVLADLNEPAAARRAAAIAADHDVSTTAIGVDVADPEQCRALIEPVTSSFAAAARPPELLVNCAALYREDRAIEMDASSWRSVIEVSLGGPFFLSQALARAVVAANTGGSIVNISSVTGTHAMAGRAAYGAAKAGLDSLTRSLALEWGRHGIRVNAIAPSHVATETITDLVARGLLDSSRITERIPLGRLAEPGEIADAVVFLCSERARFITGQVLAVDGGYTANGDWQEVRP